MPKEYKEYCLLEKRIVFERNIHYNIGQSGQKQKNFIPGSCKCQLVMAFQPSDPRKGDGYVQ